MNPEVYFSVYRGDKEVVERMLSVIVRAYATDCRLRGPVADGVMSLHRTYVSEEDVHNSISGKIQCEGRILNPLVSHTKVMRAALGAKYSFHYVLWGERDADSCFSAELACTQVVEKWGKHFSVVSLVNGLSRSNISVPSVEGWPHAHLYLIGNFPRDLSEPRLVGWIDLASDFFD